MAAAGLPEAFTFRAVEQLAIRREEGRLAELIPAWSRSPPNNPPPRPAMLRGTVAFALAWRPGALDDAALRMLDDMHRVSFRTMSDDAGWPLAVTTWSEVAVRVGDREARGFLARVGCTCTTTSCPSAPEGSAWGRRRVSSACCSSNCSTVRPMPTGHFPEAVAIARAMISPVWIARCCLDWAESLADRGDNARAQESRRRRERGDRLAHAPSPPGPVEGAQRTPQPVSV